MSIFDDDRPAKKPDHELGCDLSLLSAGELKARIGLLQDEIRRLESEIEKKNSGRSAAETLFSRKSD